MLSMLFSASARNDAWIEYPLVDSVIFLQLTKSHPIASLSDAPMSVSVSMSMSILSSFLKRIHYQPDIGRRARIQSEYNRPFMYNFFLLRYCFAESDFGMLEMRVRAVLCCC